MKILLFTLLVFLIGLTACNLTVSKKPSDNNDPIGGVEPPMSKLPIVDLGLDEARKMAFEKVKKGNQTTNYRELVVLIIDENSDLVQTVKDLGFTKKDRKNWDRYYLAIALYSNESDAKKIIDQYNIQGFPVAIKESNSVDGTEIFSKVEYGTLPWVTGENKVDVRHVIKEMYKKYQAGDKDKQLLLQLRKHLVLLGKSPEASNTLHFKITNDYLNQFSKAERITYKGYRTLKSELKNIRYDVISELIKNRDYYNEVYLKIAYDKRLKNKADADWIIEQAIVSSMKKAATVGDISLFETTLAVRNSYDKTYNSRALAEGVLGFHIKRQELEEVRFAALDYFSINTNWYAVDPRVLEISAIAVNEHSDQRSEWIEAEEWIDQSLTKNPNPTAYRLQVELLNKIGNTEKTNEILQKIKTFRDDFIAFKNHYQEQSRPIALAQKDITKNEYRKIKSISSKYKTYYRYIARESSIYKKGQSIEPIALLTENENEVSLLTRVHLVTGSILPSTHFRSYYIQSRFSLDGEHLESVYITGKEI